MHYCTKQPSTALHCTTGRSLIKLSFDIVTFILRALTAQTGLHGPEAMTSFAWSLYSHLLPVGSVDPFNLGSGLPHLA